MLSERSSGRRVLAPDPQVDVGLGQRGTQDRQQRAAALQHLHQVGELRQLLEALLGDQPRGAVVEERVLGAVLELGERRRELGEEVPLAGVEVGVLELAVQHPRADLHAAKLLVEVGTRPVDQTAVEVLVERYDPLGDAARRCDHDHHRDLRLEREHLDAVDPRRLDRRRGDERQQVGHLGEVLGGGAHRLVDLAAHVGQLDGLADSRERALFEQVVDVVAVAGVGRHAAGGGVGMLEQAEVLQPGELGADGRRPPRHVVLLGEPFRADWVVELRTALDHLLEDELLTGCDLQVHAHIVTGGRAEPRRLSRARSRPWRS